METFGILETWSLRRGGCLQEVVATGGSTVVIFKRQIKREKYNYLIIKSEVVTGKSQTEALPYYSRLRFEIFP